MVVSISTKLNQKVSGFLNIPYHIKLNQTTNKNPRSLTNQNFCDLKYFVIILVDLN